MVESQLGGGGYILGICGEENIETFSGKAFSLQFDQITAPEEG